MTTALEGGEGSASRLGRCLPPGQTRYPLYRSLGGPQGRSGQVRKISPPTEFRSPDRPARSQSLYWLSYPARKTEILGQKPVTVPLDPPKISQALVWDRTWDSAVRGRRLTAWATTSITVTASLTMPDQLLLLFVRNFHNYSPIKAQWILYNVHVQKTSSSYLTENTVRFHYIYRLLNVV